MFLAKVSLIVSLATLSFGALALDCYELGSQAELSVHIDAKKKNGTLVIGEVIKFKAKRQIVGGSLAAYKFRAGKRKYSLSILNEQISKDDKRFHGVLIDLASLDRTFLGCEI